MNNSFLNKLLPKDEYKRFNLLYYFAEAAFIFIIIIGITAVIHYYFFDLAFLINWILIAPFLMTLYIACRYTIAGMEFTEVAKKSRFLKLRKDKIIHSLIAAFVFFFLMLAFKEVAWNLKDIVSTGVYALIFGFFLYLINIFSLKRSYKMNRDLDD